MRAESFPDGRETTSAERACTLTEIMGQEAVSEKPEKVETTPRISAGPHSFL